MDYLWSSAYIWKDLSGRSYLERDGITTNAKMGQSRICQGKDMGLQNRDTIPWKYITYGFTGGESQCIGHPG